MLCRLLWDRSRWHKYMFWINCDFVTKLTRLQVLLSFFNTFLFDKMVCNGGSLALCECGLPETKADNRERNDFNPKWCPSSQCETCLLMENTLLLLLLDVLAHTKTKMMHFDNISAAGGWRADDVSLLSLHNLKASNWYRAVCSHVKSMAL